MKQQINCQNAAQAEIWVKVLQFPRRQGLFGAHHPSRPKEPQPAASPQLLAPLPVPFANTS